MCNTHTHTHMDTHTLELYIPNVSSGSLKLINIVM